MEFFREFTLTSNIMHSAKRHVANNPSMIEFQS